MSAFNNSQKSNSSFFLRPSFLHQDIETHFNHTSNNNSSNADLEFHESDLYSSDSPASSKPRKTVVSGSRRSSKVAAAAEVEATASRSVPVSIQKWSSRMMMQQQQAESERSDGDEDDGDRENRVPPHEFLARRRGASLSVHEGVGRTLKGRDMSRLRNAIWKRIGFED